MRAQADLTEGRVQARRGHGGERGVVRSITWEQDFFNRRIWSFSCFSRSCSSGRSGFPRSAARSASACVSSRTPSPGSRTQRRSRRTRSFRRLRRRLPSAAGHRSAAVPGSSACSGSGAARSGSGTEQEPSPSPKRLEVRQGAAAQASASPGSRRGGVDRRAPRRATPATLHRHRRGRDRDGHRLRDPHRADQLARAARSRRSTAAPVSSRAGRGVHDTLWISIYFGVPSPCRSSSGRPGRTSSPRSTRRRTRLMKWLAALAAVLAVGGLAFGYFIVLPDALRLPDELRLRPVPRTSRRPSRT